MSSVFYCPSESCSLARMFISSSSSSSNWSRSPSAMAETRSPSKASADRCRLLRRSKQRSSKTPEALSRTRYWSGIERLDQFGEHSIAKRLCHWAARPSWPQSLEIFRRSVLTSGSRSRPQDGPTSLCRVRVGKHRVSRDRRLEAKPWLNPK